MQSAKDTITRRNRYALSLLAFVAGGRSVNANDIRLALAEQPTRFELYPSSPGRDFVDDYLERRNA